MNQGDLAIDETADKDLLRFGDGSKNGVDVMALRVHPPTSIDRFTDDGLGEPRRGSLGGNEDHALFPDKRQRLLSSFELAHDVQ